MYMVESASIVLLEIRSSTYSIKNFAQSYSIHPTFSNIERDFYMEGLGKIIWDSQTSQMPSKMKAARNHLSSQKGFLSWEEATDLKKKTGLGGKPNDDVDESSFGNLS